MNRQRVLGAPRARRPRRGRARGGRAARGVGARVRRRARGRGRGGWVEADHDRVLQVASNLIENALRETPPGGSVTVRTEPAGCASPTPGPGLEPDDLAAAFDRFFLYDKYGRERPVGSGLGLAIVKQLAVAMGGRRHRSGAGAAPVRRRGRLSLRVSAASCRRPRSRSREPAQAMQVVVRPARVRRAGDVPVRPVVGEDHPVALQRRRALRAPAVGSRCCRSSPSAARAAPSAVATGRSSRSRSGGRGRRTRAGCARR